MILKTANEIINFEDLGFVLKTDNYEQTAGKNYIIQSIIGGSREYVFENGLKNKNLEVTLSYVADGSLKARRTAIRAITKPLLDGGKLVLDYEDDLYWRARVLEASTIKFNSAYDELTIPFNVEPIARMISKEDKTWDEIDIPWELYDVPWRGIHEVFEVDGVEDVVVNNAGNYTSKPYIIIDTTGDLTITDAKGNVLSLTGVSEILKVDCENMVVYNSSKENKLSLFSGDFIELDPGDTTVSIDGTATIIFTEKDWVI